jgi:hypothetical protein
MERQVVEAQAAKEERVEQTQHAQLMAELSALRTQLDTVQTELTELRAGPHVPQALSPPVT